LRKWRAEKKLWSIGGAKAEKTSENNILPKKLKKGDWEKKDGNYWETTLELE